MNIMEMLGFSKKGAEKKTQKKQEQEIKQDANEVKPELTPLNSFTDKYPREEGETRIYNLIIMDASGSMQYICREALTGANETIQTIRSAQQENPDDHQMLSLVIFKGVHGMPPMRTVIDTMRIEDVKDLTEEQYYPSGNTPLYDAMGSSISALKEVVREGDHVLVTVITDGLENSSRVFTAESVKALVDSLSEQGWVFTYIGANQDSVKSAAGLGIRSTMDFQASATGSTMMFRKMHSSSREYYKKVREQKLTGKVFDFNDDFFAEKQILSRVTPEMVSFLAPGQIFVFGSNEAGYHDGGASRLALERFGAVYGQGSGLQGLSYAIPTMDKQLWEIERSVEEFIAFADAHPDMTFLVTRIGCGVAGYSEMDIAPLFARAYSLPNVYLPREFWDILLYKYNR
jgi:hypothetical protein